nr:MAG TPA: hypothetical protein [Caudoviricetes sp.]
MNDLDFCPRGMPLPWRGGSAGRYSQPGSPGWHTKKGMIT